MQQKRNRPEVDDEVSEIASTPLKTKTTSESFIDPPRSTNARCEAFILFVHEVLIRRCFRKARASMVAGT
jgi:hypothetical protein